MKILKIVYPIYVLSWFPQIECFRNSSRSRPYEGLQFGGLVDGFELPKFLIKNPWIAITGWKPTLDGGTFAGMVD